MTNGGDMMNGLDRIIKAERNRRYKRLKKIRRARDKASKYIKKNVTTSMIDNFFDVQDVEWHTTNSLGKAIIECQNRILGIRIRPPKPKPISTPPSKL